MAKFFSKKRNIILLAAFVAVIVAVCIVGISVYAASMEKAEANQPAAEQADIISPVVVAARVVRAEVVGSSDAVQEPEQQAGDAADSGAIPPEAGTDTAAPPATTAAGQTQQDYSAANAPVNTPAPAATPNEAAAEAPAPVQPPAPVWVVTKSAWTEQVPVTGMVEQMICNNCGADISGVGPTVHGKNVSPEQKLAGCGGWHSEWKETITGYQEVYHPEEGYWQ